ncbi:MAG TPA: vanadium-dependent haloperoxidase, partial [Gaiellaceae bacterium]|nr:vanadium-dependent haloperoxidase [Gaiellaceae bacterium]
MFKHALAAALAGFAALIAPAVGSADTVTQWNQNAATALYVTAAQPPNVSVLHMAMVQGAVYDAVNAIDGGHEGYLLTSRVATPTDSKDAAAATAAYKVLLNIVPAQQPALQALYDASLAGFPDGSAKTRGIAVGNAAAAAMIAARTDDGRFGAFRFVNGTMPGEWRPVLPAFGSDPNAWVKDVKPFLIERASQFRSSGPYDLDSRRYAKEFDEVKSVGSLNSTRRTDDQTQAALYWNENPPRTWNRIVNSISASKGLSLVDNARLVAEVYLTAADAFIAVWDEKAHYSFWRPITAIREANT